MIVLNGMDESMQRCEDVGFIKNARATTRSLRLLQVLSAFQGRS